MKRLGTRIYTFQELMRRLMSEHLYVVESEEEPNQHFTFVPVKYMGR